MSDRRRTRADPHYFRKVNNGQASHEPRQGLDDERREAVTAIGQRQHSDTRGGTQAWAHTSGGTAKGEHRRNLAETDKSAPLRDQEKVAPTTLLYLAHESLMKINVNITGLDKLQRDLEDAQRALRSLDGEIATIKFDHDDARSVQRAIRQMETAVDKRVAPYGRNALVAKVADATKESFRKQILGRVKKA